MIDFLIESFKKQDFFSFTGYLIGLAFGVWGMWSHYANKKYKIFSYTVHTFNLINEKLKGVRGVNITFNNIDIPNLSVTEITFWNNGNETIDGNDIAKNNKLRIIVADEVEILESKILYTTNASNGIIITPDAAVDGLIISLTIDIDFDYLDSQDGMTIQLYHTGTSSSDIKLVGAIKGIKSLHRVSNYSEYELVPVEDEKKPFSRFLSAKVTPALLTGLLLVYLLIHIFVINEGKFTIINTLMFLGGACMLFYHINDYIKEKNNVLPKWIYQKQETPSN